MFKQIKSYCHCHSKGEEPKRKKEMHHCLVQHSRDELSSVYVFDLFLTIYLNFNFFSWMNFNTLWHFIICYYTTYVEKSRHKRKSVPRNSSVVLFVVYSVNKQVTKYLTLALLPKSTAQLLTVCSVIARLFQEFSLISFFINSSIFEVTQILWD